MKLFGVRFTATGSIPRRLWPVMVLAITALLVLSSCTAPAQTPTSSSVPFIAVQALAPTRVPTSTRTPTRPPARTATPVPTATYAPRPTSTPRPTHTPALPPTLAPACLGRTTAALRLRAGPSTKDAHLGSLAKGESVGILCRTSDGEWYQVRLDDGAARWVAAAYVNPEAAVESIPTARAQDLSAASTPASAHTPTLTPGPKANLATANVNLRAGPGTGYPVVGGLEKGDAVQIAGRTGDGQWYRIQRAGGSFAWVSAGYIQAGADGTSIPVVAASDIPPTPSPAPTVPPTAPPQPAYRPPTGMLEDYAPGGKGRLLIKNGTDSDALVILTGLDDKAVKSAYIRGAESFNMTGIRDGTYRLYYSKGEAFSQETHRFTRNATYQRLDSTIGFTTSATQYTAWEVTLYGVVGGNVGSEKVDPSRFP